MTKKKIVINSVVIGVLVVFLIYLLYSFWQTKDFTTLLTCGAILVVVIGVPLSFYAERLLEEDNPMNSQRLKTAYRYILETSQGTKSAFIAHNNSFIYEHFMQRGVIHELLDTADKDDPTWEITLYGKHQADIVLL